jgi:hypothetical protein
MKKRRRNIEILSLSAIDLFASALGAFFIISAILLPYYPNMKDGGITNARLVAETKVQQLEAKRSLEEAENVAKEKDQRLKEIAAAKDAAKRKAILETKMKAAKALGQALARETASLESELKKLKKQNKAKRKTAPSASGSTDFSVMGITTKAKSFVILVDLSGSMSAWSGVLVETLSKIIEPFDDSVKFAILGFQGYGVTQHWPNRRQMAIADERSKISARSFIRQLPMMVRGSTPTQSALVAGLGYRPQSIILVSDGAPDDDEPQNILRYVKGLNQGRVQINTVAVGDYLQHTALINFLNDLAKQNQGQFVGVIR